MARIHAAIAERAAQQLGLITIRQLSVLGASRQQIRTMVASGVLIRLSPSVYRHVAMPVSYDQRLLAAAWSAGPSGVVSHLAAASAWRFDGVQPGAVEVSVPLPRNPRSVTGRVHRVRDLEEADVTTLGRLPLTTPSRTLLDCASRLQLPQLEEALDGACRRGQIYLPHLAERVGALRRKGRRGITRLDQLLQQASERPRGEESWLESAFIRLLRDGGLPVPRLQVTVTVDGGLERHRLDGTYDEHQLVVEVDGHATHATRRRRQADAERDRHLVALGLRVIRYTYEDIVERPAIVRTELARFLGIELAA